jgi:hypothetical protein
MHAVLRVVAVAWVTVAWALASLYPPIEVTCAFLAGVVLLAWRRDALAPRRLLPFAAGVALGGAIAFAYYRETFAAMATTVYPGLRRAGGGGVPFEQWLSHFVPSYVIRGDQGLVNENVCEAATVGSFLPLLLVCFVDWRALARRLRASGAEARALRIELGFLAMGAVLTSVWLLAPVPSVLGMPLLWHLVPAKRMWFAAGVAIVLLALGVARHADLRLTWPRAAAALALAALLQMLSHRTLGGASALDASILALAVSVLALVMFRDRLAAVAAPALVASAALANAVAFGGFNPIQSAKPIFDPPTIPLRASLDRLAERHPRGWLVVHGSDGAWPNAWGYASVSHVLYAPALDWFRPRFPELPEVEFENLFNRTLYTFLSARTIPFLLGDAALSVPLDAFDAPRISVALGGERPQGARRGGSIDDVSVYEEAGGVHAIVRGWAPMDGSDPRTKLRVFTSLPVERATAYPSIRGDVAQAVRDPRLALSGFELRLELAPGTPAPDAPALARTPLCVLAEIPDRGAVWANGRFNPNACLAR